MSLDSLHRSLDTAAASGPVREIRIPPCPDLLRRVQETLATGSADLRELVEVAGADVAMSAALLRTAGSPLYVRERPAETVDQAIACLGLKQTAQVLTGFILRNSIRISSPMLEGFWARSARRAAALRLIARTLPGMAEDLAHTLGLFLDVGQPVMMQSLRGYGGTIAEARARIDRSFVETENANHRTDHTVVGALVARTWRLSPLLVAAIRLHHDFSIFGDDGVPSEVRSLVAASLVAEFLALQEAGLKPDRDWQRHGQTAMDWLSATEDDLIHWADQLAGADEAELA